VPIITESTYRSPKWLIGGHAQTIHPTLRCVPTLTPTSERMELEDGDFLDLDWIATDKNKLAILCHGLEGSARSRYMRGMAIALMKRGWDVLAWNFRNCSEEPNRLLSSYHSGKTDDLEHVIQHVIAKRQYDRIDLVGFSLGGNLILKYIGERGEKIDPILHRAVAFSAPCELACSSHELSKWQNQIYMQRFLKTLRAKIKVKHLRFPEDLDISGISKIQNFSQFDGRFTAPIHGFESAEDYWTRSSSRQYLSAITIPTLLINAANDPFLGPRCYPFEEAETNSFFYLEVPNQGGHVGFGGGKEYWSEKRAAEFLLGV
jgi:predicted alpha/beta-fold hydrolase